MILQNLMAALDEVLVAFEEFEVVGYHVGDETFEIVFGLPA